MQFVVFPKTMQPVQGEKHPDGGPTPSSGRDADPAGRGGEGHIVEGDHL